MQCRKRRLGDWRQTRGEKVCFFPVFTPHTHSFWEISITFAFLLVLQSETLFELQWSCWETTPWFRVSYKRFQWSQQDWKRLMCWRSGPRTFWVPLALQMQHYCFFTVCFIGMFKATKALWGFLTQLFQIQLELQNRFSFVHRQNLQSAHS